MPTPDTAASRPAAFLDRDGTMIVERDFLGDPDGVELIPGTVEAIRLLNQWGYWVLGVSNQSGVARGYFGVDDVEAVNARVIEVLSEQKARVDRIYYCRHHPDILREQGEPLCECRKPGAGMIRQALADYPVDLARSFVAGDQPADIGLARSAGLPGILLLTGFGRFHQDALPSEYRPEFVAHNLLEAVRWFGKRHDLPLILED